MAIRIEVSMPGITQAYEHLKKIGEYIEEDAGKDITKAGFNALGRLFEQNFDSEGKFVGGWPQLRERTVEDRERKGFSGSHPIMVRYRDLRDTTATALRIAGGSGTFSATDPDGGQIRVELQIGDDGGYARAFGDKAILQKAGPRRRARPYWFTTGPASREVHKRATEVLADNLKRL